MVGGMCLLAEPAPGLKIGDVTPVKGEGIVCGHRCLLRMDHGPADGEILLLEKCTTDPAAFLEIIRDRWRQESPAAPSGGGGAVEPRRRRPTISARSRLRGTDEGGATRCGTTAW